MQVAVYLHPAGTKKKRANVTAKEQLTKPLPTWPADAYFALKAYTHTGCPQTHAPPEADVTPAVTKPHTAMHKAQQESLWHGKQLVPT